MTVPDRIIPLRLIIFAQSMVVLTERWILIYVKSPVVTKRELLYRYLLPTSPMSMIFRYIL